MCADFSRQRFDPFNDYHGVLAQQGRVSLDADANEFVEMLHRRIRAQTIDTAGRVVVSKETPDAFLIAVDATNELTIALGRMYVDGLLAENHGADFGSGDFEFDRVLGERRRPAKPGTISYNDQPYRRSAKDEKPAAGAYLVYLDVWQREVTHLIAPDLVEPAVGVDSTARMQTVWQVRLLEPEASSAAGAPPTCAAVDLEKLLPPSGARLSSDAQGVPTKEEPCLLPPTGGYRGLENQLYRVEIHDGGDATNATFKWSRENASVATRITAINAARNELSVASTGRDNVLCFKPGDWVEITDDTRELEGQPGAMHKVKTVDAIGRKLTLETALAAGAFPDPDDNARIIRWDQAKRVLAADRTQVFDLDDASSDGVIPISALAGKPVLLEDGVQITLTLDATGGEFRTGDYWVFAARAADASVEKLVGAPPRGIHHHYAKLAIVTFPATGAPSVSEDCGPKDPTPTGPGSSECCDCTVCVSAAQQEKDPDAIQKAIEAVKKRGGGTVCLDAGEYFIKAPLKIVEAKSVRLKGQGSGTNLTNASGSGIVISSSLDVTIEDLALAVSGAGNLAAIVPVFACVIDNSATVTIQRCHLTQTGAGAVMALARIVADTFIRENIMTGASGIIGTQTEGERALTSGVCLLDNFIVTAGAGVSFEKFWFHDADNRIAGNFFKGSAQAAAILATGFVAPGSRLDIVGNLIRTAGDGIVIGTGDTRIARNDIGPDFKEGGDLQTNDAAAGITLVPGEVGKVEGCQILANRIRDLGGVGIRIATTTSAIIEQNIIERTGRGGIVMDLNKEVAAGTLTIANNQLRDIAPKVVEAGEILAAVRVTNATQTRITGNTIIGVAEGATGRIRIAGIAVLNAISAQITGNHLRNIGHPKLENGTAAGIIAAGFLGRIDVANNEVKRSPGADLAPTGAWRALSIATREGSGFAEIDKATLAQATDLSFQPNERVTPSCAVRGNLFDGFGALALVLAAIEGSCIVAENRVLFLNRNGVPIAQMTAGALILTSNHFEGVTRNSVQAIVDPKLCTVLGNISNAPILVGTPPAPLGAPWNALNVVV